jgi:hypothetical protein
LLLRGCLAVAGGRMPLFKPVDLVIQWTFSFHYEQVVFCLNELLVLWTSVLWWPSRMVLWLLLFYLYYLYSVNLATDRRHWSGVGRRLLLVPACLSACRMIAAGRLLLNATTRWPAAADGLLLNATTRWPAKITLLFRLKKISTWWIVPLSSYLTNIVQSWTN